MKLVEAIIHEVVAARLRVLPQVVDLGQDGYVSLRAHEAEVGVHGEASSRQAEQNKLFTYLLCNRMGSLHFDSQFFF